MEDIIPRAKLLFWILFIASAVLAALPSVILLDTAQQYWRFLSGWNPKTLKSTTLHSAPHGNGMRADPMLRIQFVEFRLHSPKARRVLLAGDFNRWNPQTLPLVMKKKGTWEIQVPLPLGKYQYLFQVDGEWTPDPASMETGQRGELKTSIRHVRSEK